MRLKPAVVTVFVTFIVCFALNAIFHTLIIDDFFAAQLSGFGDKLNSSSDINPAWLAITEFIWVCALFYFLTLKSPGRLTLNHAIIGGMLMNASVSGTWNFINLALFNAFPGSLILPDMSFHVFVIGPVSGWLIFRLFNKFGRS